MVDRLDKLNKFIFENGGVTRASTILGYRASDFYRMRKGLDEISDEILKRIDEGRGERRIKAGSGRAIAAAKIEKKYHFDANADISTMSENDIVKFLNVIEISLASNRYTIETEMEIAKSKIAEAEKQIPELLELCRKIIAEQTKRKMKKLGITDDMRVAIAKETGSTRAVAQRYGVGATTVRRIRQSNT